jgi:hypothetical protein
MKDLPHHMKKLNRRVIRSENRLIESELESIEEVNILSQAPRVERPKGQTRKQIKSQMRKDTLAHTPEHATPDERNRDMKHRVPIFDRLSHPRAKVSAKPKKKTPRY